MTAADLSAVIALDRATPDAPHWSLANYRSCLDASSGSSSKHVALVAEIDRLAGFAVMGLVNTGESPEAELECIVVAAELRQLGIGRRLMTEVVRRAALADASRLDLEVRASNRAAIALYRRMGWTQTGRRLRYYSNPEEDALLMSLTL